jgi:hypothetical protein
MFGPNMMQSQMEAGGLPISQPAKEYRQRYPESLTRAALSLLFGLQIRLIRVSLFWGCIIWLAVYFLAVVALYWMKIPKVFAVGHEVQLLFQHFCAFLLTYVFIDNAISTFTK